MSPWPPEGEPHGKGTKAVTLPRPGHADLAGVQKYGLDRRPRRARARLRPAHGRARGGRRGREGAARHDRDRGRRRSTVDEAGCGAARSTRPGPSGTRVGGVVEVRAHGVPPGLGSYASKDDRLDARLAAALMGIQAVKGVEIGDGFALAAAARLRGARRDRHATGAARRTAPAGIEGGDLERRGDRRARRDEAAADADEAARARSISPRARPAQALVERSDVAAVEALAVVAEAAVAWELARAAREKFGGDAIGDFVAARRRISSASPGTWHA